MLLKFNGYGADARNIAQFSTGIGGDGSVWVSALFILRSSRFALNDFFIDFMRVTSFDVCQYRFALKHFYAQRGIAGRSRIGFIHFDRFRLEGFVPILMTNQL
jgi:hypothetical protein